jgi:hypothetical protein
MKINGFEHRMAAHCETGTIMAQLNHAGLQISEQMIFGVSSGIFFAYLVSKKLPFPMFVPRSIPGDIRKKLTKRLGVKFRTARFSDPVKAQKALDAALEKKIPVAVQVDLFNMEYFPAYMRHHFNGHFINVLAKEGSDYLISDCYHPQVARISDALLSSARFACGDMAPHGLMFYAVEVPGSIDLRRPIYKGLQGACWNMIKIPVPFVGVRGIRMLAAKLPDWPKLAWDEEYLSHQIMSINLILEERGTGGAGFRFMFASFLQEAAKIVGRDDLAAMSKRMMEIGDRWRELSLVAARMGKNHDFAPERFKDLQERIRSRADDEEAFFKDLQALVKRTQ